MYTSEQVLERKNTIFCPIHIQNLQKQFDASVATSSSRQGKGEGASIASAPSLPSSSQTLLPPSSSSSSSLSSSTMAALGEKIPQLHAKFEASQGAISAVG